MPLMLYYLIALADHQDQRTPNARTDHLQNILSPDGVGQEPHPTTIEMRLHPAKLAMTIAPILRQTPAGFAEQ